MATGPGPPLEVRQRLYDILRQDVPFDEKVRDVLELGADFLGVDDGHLTRIDEETNHWETVVTTDAADDALPHARELDLRETYCRETIKNDTYYALHDAPNQGWAEDPAFENRHHHSYLGMPLVPGEDAYGTVCFFAGEPREEPFTDGEVLFAELLTRLLEREFERDQLNTELTRQSNLATVLNRVLRHNLRNDMSVVRGFTQLMADELGEDAKGDVALANIDDLLELADKARELDRIIATDFERQRTDVVALVESVVETVSVAHPSASISVEYDEELATALLPSFERAVEELVENAAQHAGESPTVTVAIESVSDAFEIRIVDDGPGLGENEAAVLTTGEETPLTHGSGLGLWLAYWIVTSHSGSIEASATEVGTVMTISVPNEVATPVQHRMPELTRAPDQYEAAFENAYDAMLIVDDNSTIVNANPAASDIFGLDHRELLGRSRQDFLPDDFDSDAEWQGFQSAGMTRQTVTIVGADGVERTVEYSATADIVPGHHLFLSRDVTERIEHERRLHEQQQELTHARDRFRSIFEHSNDAIVIFDPEIDGILEANQRASELLGYSRAELLALAPADIHPTDLQQFQAFVDSIRTERSGWTDRLTCVTKYGERIPVEISASLLEFNGRDGVLALIRDVREQRKYQAAFEEASDPTVIVGDEGEILEANRAASALFGRDTRELRNRDVSSFFEDEAELWDVPPGSQPTDVNRDTATLAANGRERSVEYTITADVVSGEHLVVFRDVTERQERERALGQFKRAVEASSHSVYITSPDGTIEYVNPAFERITEYGAAAAIGHTPRLLKSGEHNEQFYADMWETILGGETWQGELVNSTKDGDRYVVNQTISPIFDEAGEIVNFVAVNADITERKRRERELERYNTAFKEAGDGMTITDDDARILDVNFEAARIYGEDRKQLVDRPMREFLPNDFDFEAEWGKIQAARMKRDEIPIASADGGTRSVEYTAKPNFTPGMHLIVSRDITERKERERKLERQIERLNEFIGVLTHDLRNPLNVAQGRLELASERYDSEHFEPIERAHERMESLIGDLLTLAREGKAVTDVEPIELSAIARRCWSNVDTMDAAIVDETERTLEADRTRLEQVLENLFRNAVEHGGQDVTVTVSELDDGFYVADDGVGIPDDERAAVFENGYSSHRDGTGFGLTIVTQVAEAHGWDVHVTDSSAGGARFEITGVTFETGQDA